MKMISAPFGALHRRQKGAGEADAAQDIDLEESHPVGVGDVLEGLRLENPEVVDEDVDFGMAARQILGRPGRPEIAGEADQITAGLGLERGNRLVDVARRAAVDDHAGSLARKVRGDGGANARGAARHQRPLAVEFEVHASLPE